MKKILLFVVLALSACKIPADESASGSRTVSTIGDSRGSRSFSGLAGITTDPFGNVFFAERSAGVLRKITPDGMISTVAARFSLPTGLTSDSSGNIYVADTGSSLIRKIDPNGVVTSVCSVAANGITLADANTLFVSSGHAIFQVVLKGANLCDVTHLAGSSSSSGFS